MIMELLTVFILGFLWYQVIAIFGISIGLHRHFAHRQFDVSKIYEVIILFLITLTGARSPLGWIGAHRIHHANADTENDPHSPDIKGFWNIVFNRWTCKNIPRKYIKDVIKNPRIIFFHKYWKYIHLIVAIISLLIGLNFFIAFIVIPYVLGFFGYGYFNAAGHKDYKPRTNFWINILSAGEGFHDVHHNNEKLLRLNKYDISGIIIERFNEKK
jgi:stearoyl-CoA desaturase (delta-9 desaturase)